MAEIPDNISVYLKGCRSTTFGFWHFYAACSVPLAFTADAKLLSQIDARSSAVNGYSINSVKGKTAVGLEEFGHPQPDWAERLYSRTMFCANNTRTMDIPLGSTKPIRTWPAVLRPDFLRAIDRLKPDQDLLNVFVTATSTQSAVVQKLPERIDATESMQSMDADGFNSGSFGTSEEITDERTDRTVLWNSSDQMIYQSFYWTTTPSTKQVLWLRKNFGRMEYSVMLLPKQTKNHQVITMQRFLMSVNWQ